MTGSRPSLRRRTDASIAAECFRMLRWVHQLDGGWRERMEAYGPRGHVRRPKSTFWPLLSPPKKHLSACFGNRPLFELTEVLTERPASNWLPHHHKPTLVAVRECVIHKAVIFIYHGSVCITPSVIIVIDASYSRITTGSGVHASNLRTMSIPGLVS